MKQLRICLLIFVLTILGLTNSLGQELSGSILSKKLHERAQIASDYITALTQKDRSADIKKYYIEQILSLFVNNGEPFKVDSIEYEGSYILTTSQYRNKPVKRKIKDYLQGLMDSRYEPVDLSKVKIPDLPIQINRNNFIKCGNNLYKFITVITRELAGYIDGVPVYKDITPYEYSIFIKYDDTLEEKYIVYLSNIEVEEK